LHKAYVLVNEAGTEAAAATIFGARPASLPQELRIDRPFIFLIRDVPTGTILFVGRVLNPLEK
jgi:serpin B